MVVNLMKHTAMRFILQLSDAKAILFEDLESQKNKWESELNRIFKFMDTLTTDFVGNWFVYYDDECYSLHSFGNSGNLCCKQAAYSAIITNIIMALQFAKADMERF